MRSVPLCAILVVTLLRPTPARADWDPRFGGNTIGDPGFAGSVRALTNDGSTVYVAGGFWGVYRWTGSTWTRVGGPLASNVSALAVTSNHDVYAGGSFLNMSLATGDVPANHIARWNGGDWVPLDVGGNVGMNQAVHALATAGNGTDVYAGGSFTQAGGVNHNYVARWDGAAWQTVANNLFNGTVRDIHVAGNDVYFGGSFTLFGQRVAHYNGSSFEFFNGGPNATVYAVTVFDGELHAAGSFTSAGGVAAEGVARYDGTDWHAVVTSVTSQYSGPMRDLVVHDGALYLSGGFSEINGIAANNVARWSGSGWSRLGPGVSGGMAFAVGSADGELWVGGDFVGVGAWPSLGVARWEGGTWGFGGANDIVRDVAGETDNMIVVGDFLQVGDTPANRVARWNGNAWSALGAGVDGSARCVATNGNDVYVGGDFDNAGGGSAAGIARWNGSAWSPLGYGLIGIPYDLELVGGDLYVAGTLKPLATPIDNIVRWDGSAWHAVGSGYPNAAARCVVVDDGRVFIGGDFTTIGAMPANRIAVFDGVAWSTLGTGCNATVYGIAVNGDDVFAVGDFTSAGGVPASRIAHWDGTQWLPLGTGLNGGGRRIAVAGNQLVVAGDFTTMNGMPAANLAYGIGSQWSGLGGGADDRILAMAVTSDGVFVGGEFRTAGSTPSDRVAFWQQQFATPVVSAPGTALRLQQNIPNPFNPTTTIRYTLDRPGRATLRVYDVRGALVRTLVDATQTSGPREVVWDGRDARGRTVASGVYFCRLGTASENRVIRMTVLK
jgi:hypothetical protein